MRSISVMASWAPNILRDESTGGIRGSSAMGRGGLDPPPWGPDPASSSPDLRGSASSDRGAATA
jgi:hypothetical protein